MSERYMKNFNGEKVFSLEYDKETLKDMVLELQEEIKRLRHNQEVSTKWEIELTGRISKAIEYIEKTNFWGIYEDTPMSEVKYGSELLEILKGEDKE